MNLRIKKNMEKLNLHRMQELLPDYVFGKLDNEEKALFEHNLQFYPEIKQEADDAKRVFQRFEQMDVDAFLNSKTKNTSVAVHRKLEKRPKGLGKFAMAKYYLPIAAAIALIYIVYNSNDNNSLSKQEIVAHQTKGFVSVNDVNIIIDSTSSQIEVTETTEVIINNNKGVFSDIIPDTETANNLSDKLLSQELAKIDAEELLISDNSNINLLSGLEELDETQFQTFLKELKK